MPVMPRWSSKPAWVSALCMAGIVGLVAAAPVDKAKDAPKGKAVPGKTTSGKSTGPAREMMKDSAAKSDDVDDSPAPSKSATKSAASAPVSGKTTGARLDFIDKDLREAWASASIKPSPMATDPEFMRRAYLDVLGRTPNITEAKAFLSSKDKGKRAKLVEYLLAHPDYEKNFANIWKVILIGRQNQGQDVSEKALRDWLRRQFADNRPWNEISYELITATGNNKTNGSANFVMSHLEGGAVPLTSIITRTFLSQQIQCTQCHDHPSNDWKQPDFWGINAFLKGIKTERVRVEDATGASVVDHVEVTDMPTDAFASFERRDARVGIAFPTFLDGRKISQGKDVNRRQALGKFITEPANDTFPKAFVNRMWGHFMGKGFVNPLDDFGAHNEPSHPELLDKLGAEFRNSKYDVKQLIRWIMNSEAYNLTSSSTKSNDKDETLFSHMTLKPMSPEQLFDSLIVATAAHKSGGGDNDGRRNEWMRQFQFAFANDEGDEGTSFQGTIPQALMMMNGPLMAEAVGGKPGSFLADLLASAQRQGGDPGAYIINHLYLAALSRYPTGPELSTFHHVFNNNPDKIYVMEDIFWALLNSNEFVLNR